MKSPILSKFWSRDLKRKKTKMMSWSRKGDFYPIDLCTTAITFFRPASQRIQLAPIIFSFSLHRILLFLIDDDEMRILGPVDYSLKYQFMLATPYFLGKFESFLFYSSLIVVKDLANNATKGEPSLI